MNMLKNFICLGSKLSRSFETSQNFKWSDKVDKTLLPYRRIVVEPLSEREVVRVKGEEAVPFLQGLITNDITHLEHIAVSSMYAMFLNKAGRILYDSIIYRGSEPNTYLIECDKKISKELQRHLTLFRVRRKIEIDCLGEELRPWIAFSADEGDSIRVDAPLSMQKEIISAPDPRFRELGLRLITTADKTWKDMAEIFLKPGGFSVAEPTEKCNYRLHRYRHGVSEGVTDLPPGKCFPLEANCDFLHGVSFQKGCYIGQELTARVYHTGVIRKRIIPMRLSAPILSKDAIVQTEAGAKVGTIRNVYLDRALALLRVEQALSASRLLIDGDPCYVEKPRWWPNELPRRVNQREGY